MSQAFVGDLIDRVGNLGGEIDDPEVRVQKIALLLLTIAWSIILAIQGFIELSSRSSLGYVAHPMLVVTIANVLIYLRTQAYESFRSRQFAIFLLTPLLAHLLFGGFAGSAILIFCLLTPLIALLGSRPREATPWFLGSIAVVLISAALEPQLFPESGITARSALLNFGLNIIAITTMTFYLVVYFVNQKNRAYAALSEEQKKSEDLLLNVLPKEIAPLLKSGRDTIADHFEAASILFADIVGFTPLSARWVPDRMVEMLNRIFSEFDGMVAKYDLEKVRTIGDNYMVASGVPRPRNDHAQAIAKLALEMEGYIRSFPAQNGHRIEFRVGINSGPVVAGVIGRQKFHYDLWGEAVNTASRMESHGVPGKIQVSTATYELIKDEFICEPRGRLEVKGIGEMDTWFLLGKKQTGDGHALPRSA